MTERPQTTPGGLSSEQPSRKPVGQSLLADALKGQAVYEVCGWFGDQEWSEGLYADKDEADSACTQLWAERSGPNGPEHSHGLHKFAVEERTIQ